MKSPIPPEAAQFLDEARTLEEIGEFESALRRCESALRLAPQWAAAHYLHGVILNDLERPEEAITAYQEAVQLDPTFTEAIAALAAAEQELADIPGLPEAYEYEAAGNLQAALELCDSILENRPELAEVHNLRGIVLDQLNRPWAALQAYRQAVTLDPTFTEAQENLAEAEQELATIPPLDEIYARQTAGDLEGALALCDQILALSPDHAEAHYLRGGLLHQLGRLWEAMSAYQAALQIDPAFAAAGEALELARQEFQLAPDLSAAYALYEEAGDPQAALALCDQILALVPEVAEAHNLRGVLLDELERPWEAIRAYRQAVALAPDFTEAQDNLADAEQEFAAEPDLHEVHQLADAGDLWGAVTLCEEILMLVPELTEAYHLRQRLLERFERSRSAAVADEWTTELEVPPLVANPLESAYASEAAGDLETALAQCEQALAAEPTSAEAHNLRGIILDQLDRLPEAIAAYRQAVSLDPDFDEARENLAEAEAELRQVSAPTPAAEATPVATDTDTPLCPHCRSTDVSRVGWLKKQWRCEHCGTTW